MKHCIIYAHPNPNSFNHAIKEKVTQILQDKREPYTLIDLYAESFNPVLSPNDFIAEQEGTFLPDVQAHQALIREADHLIFIYPIWWYGQPAILKGWIDRVFRHHFAYAVGEKQTLIPLLTNKSATLFVTLGQAQDKLQARQIEHFMDPMVIGTLNLVGIRTINCYPFYSVPILSDQERCTLLDTIQI